MDRGPCNLHGAAGGDDVLVDLPDLTELGPGHRRGRRGGGDGGSIKREYEGDRSPPPATIITNGGGSREGRGRRGRGG